MEHLLSPIEVRGKRIKNRVTLTAHPELAALGADAADLSPAICPAGCSDELKRFR